MHRLLHLRLPGLGRLGLPAVAVLTLALAGCSDPAASTPAAPPASPAPATTIAPTVSSGGSDGLTVRYLGDDGTIKTVRVEDFPR